MLSVNWMDLDRRGVCLESSGQPDVERAAAEAIEANKEIAEWFRG